MDSAPIQITGKIISKQDGISLFKIGYKKQRLELPKLHRDTEPLFPLSVTEKRGGGEVWHNVILDWPLCHKPGFKNFKHMFQR